MTETPGPEQNDEPEQHPHHEHHGLRDELHRLEDEAYVDSYNWGPVVMGILLVVILVGVAIVGWVWFA